MSSSLFIDIGRLKRFPDYRRLWTGLAVRQMGAQLTLVTVLYQVFQLTHSNLAVGLVSAVQVVPGVTVPLFGGAIVDAMDRRKLLMILAVLIGGSTTVLAVNSIGDHPALWVLYVMSATTWALNGIDAPTRQAAQIGLVDHASITAVNVLRQTLSQTAVVVGPGFAGILIAAFSHNIDIVYWIDVASTLWVLQTVFRLPKMVPAGGGRKFGFASMIEGFQFLKGRRVIQACFITDINATLLGLPTALFPYMATVHFHGGARTFGLLTSAPGLGALIGSLLSGWITRVRFQGRAVLISVSVWGIAIAAFGLVPWLALALVLLAVAGWADTSSAALRQAIIQTETPDVLRGRLSSLSTASVQAGKLGNAEAGLVAALSNAQISIISGGLGCVAGVLLIARFVPSYAKYQLHRPETDPDPLLAPQ